MKRVTGDVGKDGELGKNCMDNILKNRELVSALTDGHLRGEAFACAVEASVHDADARATWHAYHVLGDALRSPDLAHCSVSAGFMTRFQARLQAEALHAPQPAVSLPVVPQPAVVRSVQVDEAANHSVFRWKMVAGFASMAAVAAIGWNLMGSLNAGTGQTLAAAQAVPVLTAATVNTPPSSPQNGQPLVMIRDAHLDALLAAHKQFGGTSALQAPSGFLRNATFEVTGR